MIVNITEKTVVNYITLARPHHYIMDV